MKKTPHELIKSRQSPYNHFKDKAMMMLIEAGNFKTKYCGCVIDFNVLGYPARFDAWGFEKRRVYGDEIICPDFNFCMARVEYFRRKNNSKSQLSGMIWFKKSRSLWLSAAKKMLNH